jgi:hypothetical protein
MTQTAPSNLRDPAKEFVARRPVFAGHGATGSLVAAGSTLVLKDKVFQKPEEAPRASTGPSVIPANTPEAEGLAQMAAIKARTEEVGTPSVGLALSDAKNLSPELLAAGGLAGGPNDKDPPTPLQPNGEAFDPLLTATDATAPAPEQTGDGLDAKPKDDLKDILEDEGTEITPEINKMKKDELVALVREKRAAKA